MDRCPKCDLDVGAPNIREVQHNEERDALEQRYRQAKVDATSRDVDDRLSSFETAVGARSTAVINVSPSFLAEFLDAKRTLFSNYSLQVFGGTRKPASIKDDRQRRGVEGTLFGNYAPKIRYAALSLNGLGLVSYGSCAVAIADVTMSAKATILEENAFTFIRNHKIMPGDEIPKGYRAAWRDRHKLAVAKLEPKVHSSTSEGTFASLLLHSDGDRAHDDFLEVHIYGSFDHQAIDGVIAPCPETAPRAQRGDLKRIRDRIRRSGKKWSER